MLALVIVASGALALGCQETYRVGDYVLVEWYGKDYPAYVIERRSSMRFRVHFDGYGDRWDEDVSLDRIRGRVEGTVTPPPPPEPVARALGLRPTGASSASATGSHYKAGDRVQVRWRGSLYNATITEVLGTDRVGIHYDGHEKEWDEIVSIDRIIARRK